MYKNILLCLDGSEMDTPIIQMGISFAKKFNVTLHGLTVKDRTMLEGPLMYDLSGALAFIPQVNLMDETRKALEARAQNILEGFEGECEKAQLKFQTKSAEGVIHRVISEETALHDLTLIGRRGLHYQWDKELLGSTADRVIRHSHNPVMVVTHDFKAFQNPLVAYDGSHHSKKALATAANLCSEMKLPLTVLHVSSKSNDELKDDLLSEAKAYLDSYELVVKYEKEQGDPHETISQYAKKHSHDLVILGARGRTGLLEFIFGSTTQYTLWSGAFHVLVDHAA